MSPSAGHAATSPARAAATATATAGATAKAGATASATPIWDSGRQTAELMFTGAHARAHTMSAAKPVWYTTRSGDSLSSIADRFYHNAAAWPVLYYANRGALRGSATLRSGQRLRIPPRPSHIPGAPTQSAAAATATSTATGSTATGSTASGTANSKVSTSGYSAFQACVIQRESGGNAQIMNASGHYGLYQFSYSTWVAYGGAPSEFGHATVAEQNQVFANAIAAGGQSNWSAYDGC